jgi:hypothetical protein
VFDRESNILPAAPLQLLLWQRIERINSQHLNPGIPRQSREGAWAAGTIQHLLPLPLLQVKVEEATSFLAGAPKKHNAGQFHYLELNEWSGRNPNPSRSRHNFERDKISILRLCRCEQALMASKSRYGLCKDQAWEEEVSEKILPEGTLS